MFAKVSRSSVSLHCLKRASRLAPNLSDGANNSSQEPRALLHTDKVLGANLTPVISPICWQLPDFTLANALLAA